VNKYTALKYLKLIILLNLLVLISCGDNEDKPKDLLTREQMTDVLIDIHMTESALTLKSFSRDSSLVLFQLYKEEIFKRKKITEKQFQDSYNYYSIHSAGLDKIYEVVIDSLAVMESKEKPKL
jgi:hypothetical protein